MHCSPRDPTAPWHGACALSHSQPLLLCRCSRLLPAQPQGSCCPMPNPTRPGPGPAPSPRLGAFSLSFLPGVLCSGGAPCSLTNKAASPCHAVAASLSHTMVSSLFHAVVTSPSHVRDAWKDVTQAAASTDSVMPPRVPSLCPAWGCPMGPWPQLSLHSGSSTLGPPPCSEHGCRGAAVSVSHQSRGALCSLLCNGQGTNRLQCAPTHGHHLNSS